MATVVTPEQLSNDVRQLIVTSFFAHMPQFQLSADADLLTLLSSLQLLRLVMGLESRFGIKIENSELTPETLGTIEKVSRLIAAKLK